MINYKKFFLIVIGAFIAFLVFITSWLCPIIVTDREIARALEEVKHLDNPPAFMELIEKDYWGNPLVFRFDRTTHRLTYTVISKGRDGIEGSSDDRSETYVDYNVSRMAGEWTAEKTKEFLKGLKEGVEKKSKYEDDKK